MARATHGWTNALFEAAVNQTIANSKVTVGYPYYWYNSWSLSYANGEAIHEESILESGVLQFTYSVAAALSYVQPCFSGDAFCELLGHPVRRHGNIESDDAANMAMASLAYLPLDVSMVQSGRLFGTRYGGNTPVFNSNDYLRVGWSYLRGTGEYGFRVAGKALDWLTSVPKTHWWIWGGPQ